MNHALNRAVAVSMVSGPGAALAEVEELERDSRLATYQYLPAIKADLCGSWVAWKSGCGRQRRARPDR